MPLRDGDVVDFDYELWVEGREALYDTTLRDAAEAAGILEDNAYYAPMTYVLGSGRLIPGLEKALRGAPIDQVQTVELEPKEAYGERDAKLLETLPMTEFKKGDVTPQVGLPVSYKNRRGVVSTVGGGRVRVDFNHPLAGKRLRYRFTVRRVAEGEDQRIAGILRMHFPARVDWRVEVGDVDGKPTATIHTPEAALFHQNWVVAKLRVLMDIRRFARVERVRFLETFPLNRPPEEEPAESAAPGATS